MESRLIRTVSNRSHGCQTLINLHRGASSRTHLVLQAYCLTDVDEINPLGIEIWYRTTRRFSILGGIEAILSVPKKYRTRYPALLLTQEVTPIVMKTKCLFQPSHCHANHQFQKHFKKTFLITMWKLWWTGLPGDLRSPRLEQVCF